MAHSPVEFRDGHLCFVGACGFEGYKMTLIPGEVRGMPSLIGSALWPCLSAKLDGAALGD
jgi:hypothetical protein